MHARNSRPVVSLVVLFTLFVSAVAAASPHRAGFSIRFQELESNLTILTTAVMPNETLPVGTSADARADRGTLLRRGDDWVWTAPAEPGRATLLFTQGGDSIHLNVFILTPFSNGRQNHLQGFRIGRYAEKPFRALNSYRAPEGFINLAHGPEDLKISPHFTLAQFLCNQQPGHDPTFLLLRAAMLIKLETLLEAANARGWRADTFYVMSAFRTPHYNRAIGNVTDSSRHLYGGAADIWIDHDGDGQMDDLNGDGRINKDDARELARLADSLSARGGPDWPVGGIGIYRANAVHGPFVHIDARGYQARWE